MCSQVSHLIFLLCLNTCNSSFKALTNIFEGLDFLLPNYYEQNKTARSEIYQWHRHLNLLNLGLAWDICYEIYTYICTHIYTYIKCFNANTNYHLTLAQRRICLNFLPSHDCRSWVKIYYSGHEALSLKMGSVCLSFVSFYLVLPILHFGC